MRDVDELAVGLPQNRRGVGDKCVEEIDGSIILTHGGFLLGERRGGVGCACGATVGRCGGQRKQTLPETVDEGKIRRVDGIEQVAAVCDRIGCLVAEPCVTHQHLADGEFEPGREDIVGIFRTREVGDVRLGTHGDLCDCALQILVADFFGNLPFADVPLFFARRKDAGSERRITAL